MPRNLWKAVRELLGRKPTAEQRDQDRRDLDKAERARRAALEAEFLEAVRTGD